MSDAPIGVFDSGVGGLTVARAIIDQLPRESILYVGDTAHTPYGPKPIADVRRYGLEVLDTLVDAVKNMGQVPGRFERVAAATDKGFVVVVDYAHTELGLELVLDGLKAPT